MKRLDSGLHLSACGHAQAGRNDGGMDNDKTVHNGDLIDIDYGWDDHFTGIQQSATGFE
ncbi:MAG: hypothetical protein JW932_03370 [Deltaproteobacteria bacterium]|nr:hypothetical protein [Deltaproteobacteria bacterium]